MGAGDLSKFGGNRRPCTQVRKTTMDRESMPLGYVNVVTAGFYIPLWLGNRVVVGPTQKVFMSSWCHATL